LDLDAIDLPSALSALSALGSRLSRLSALGSRLYLLCVCVLLLASYFYLLASLSFYLFSPACLRLGTRWSL
jgi:hypothetical protein